MHKDSLVVFSGRPDRITDAPLNGPIHINSTHYGDGQLIYGRYGNETWQQLELAISDLEGGKTLVFSSGMAAISAFLNTLSPGSRIVALKNGYAGTLLWLKNANESGRFNVEFVDTSDTATLLNSVLGADVLFLESPTNPLIEVVDLPVVIPFAKNIGCAVVVDNTFATPLNQNPIKMGADVVVHSLTKYISGHSDIVLGSITTNDDSLYSKLDLERKLGGGIAGPMESWLALRGLRTLSVRLEKSQDNAIKIANRLNNSPFINKVMYPGLESDPFHSRASSFMTGFGAVMSFEINGTAEQAEQICLSSNLVAYATSLGGVESLWERRRRIKSEMTNIPENLIRLSVGIENVEDLWDDISSSICKVLG